MVGVPVVVRAPQCDNHAIQEDDLATIDSQYIYHNCHFTLNICAYTETFNMLFNKAEHIKILLPSPAH